MEGLVQVFLAVIALGALLQAAFVAALAIAMGKAADEVDRFVDDYDRKMAPLTARLGQLAGSVAQSSDGAVDAARRAELRISALADRFGEGVGATAEGLGETFTETAESLTGRPARPRRGMLHRLRAAWAGFNEGVDAFIDPD